MKRRTIGMTLAFFALCSTAMAETTDGVCGADNKKVVTALPINLCAEGNATPIETSTDGKKYVWQCKGHMGNEAYCYSHKKQSDMAEKASMNLYANGCSYRMRIPETSVADFLKEHPSCTAWCHGSLYRTCQVF